MELIWLILGSLVFTTIFTGSETAFSTSNKFRMELNIKQGGINAYILNIFTKNSQLFRITLSLGYHFFLVGFATSVFLLWGVPNGGPTVISIGFMLFAAVFAAISIALMAELLGTTLVKYNPNNFLNIFLVPLFIFFILFIPLSWFLIAFSRICKGLFFKTSAISLVPTLANADLDLWVQKQSEPGEPAKENQELKMLQNALEFPKIRIRDCMIPRTEIEAIDINAGIEAVKRKFISTGYSKIIVYQGTTDNIVGYINSKELFKHPGSIKEKLSEIAFVPETMPASKMLHEFMQYHRSIAVVVDEYGGISGMITLEDIIEEIFGEIEDEHDTDEWVEKQIKPNEFVLAGRLEIEHLNTEYHLQLEESEEYDTLAGFILYHHHTLPKRNDIIEIGQYSFKILKVSNTRIELVYLKVLDSRDLKKTETKQKKNTL